MNNYSKPTSTGGAEKIKSRPQTWLQATPTATAIMTKLIPDTAHHSTQPGNGVDVRDPTIFDRLVSKRAQRNLDAQTIISLAPDIKLIKQMIVSTTLSPVDMTEGELTFKTDATDISPLILNDITAIIRDHFETYYPLRERLPEIIGEALFDSGAWVSVIVPEAVIDDIVNSREVGSHISNESLNQMVQSQFKDGTLRPTGILGNPGKTDEEIAAEIAGKKTGKTTVSAPSLENMFAPIDYSDISVKIHDGATITDNLAIMGLSALRDRVNGEKLRNHYRVGGGRVALESMRRGTGHNNVSTVANSLYQTRGGGSSIRPVSVMHAATEASRSSIGHPLVIKCPSESVIPCYPKGDERNHIGYVIILDELGNPINLTDELDRAVTSGQLGALGGEQQMSMTSSLIQQTRIATNGTCMNVNALKDEERIRVYNQVLEENILNRIKNGLVGRNVKMAWNEDIMRIMLFRRYANLRTNLVFVPAEQVAYFAYDYDNNGMGKSLLDDVKQVSALRAMSTFANFMAGVKNAVGRTKLTMTIDPRNPDPEKAYHVLIDEYQRMQAGPTPTDVSSSAEMFRVLRMMGTTIEVQGNPRMPNTTVDIAEFQSQKQEINENFMADLRRQQYMGLFVTPGMVDMTDDADFAITRWTSNQLYAKRIMMIQDDTCKHGKKFVKSYTLSDGILLNRIQRVLEEHDEKLPEQYRLGKESQIPDELRYLDVIDLYFEAFYLELPRPENNRIEKQKEEFDKVKDFIDDIVDAYVSDELLGAFTPEETTRIGLLRAQIVAYLKREYLAQNGIDFGINKMISPVSEEDPAIELIKSFGVNITNLMNNVGDFANGVNAIRQDFLAKLAATNPKQAETLTPPDSAGGWDAGSSSQDNGGGFSDDFGGDFGGDFTDDSFSNPEADGEMTSEEGQDDSSFDAPPSDDIAPLS